MYISQLTKSNVNSVVELIIFIGRDKLEKSNIDLINECVNLETILIESIKLTNIDFTRFNKLKKLIIKSSIIGKIDLSKCINLEFIELYNIHQEIDLNNLYNLKNIKIIGCENVKIINLINFLNIELLEISAKYIDIKQLYNLIKLKYLSLSNIDSFTVDLTKNINLLSLSIENSKLKILDLTKNINLTVLIINYNEIATINITNLLLLTYIHIKNNKLLKYIELDKNIIDIALISNCGDFQIIFNEYEPEKYYGRHFNSLLEIVDIKNTIQCIKCKKYSYNFSNIGKLYDVYDKLYLLDIVTIKCC